MAEGDIKLFYFDSRGKAELARLVLALGGRSFEDIRFSRDEWPNYKTKAPFGQAPFIEYKGKHYAQSLAIANFCARELGFYGKSSMDALRIDEVTGIADDIWKCVSKVFYEKDEAKKAEYKKKMVEEDMPRMFGFYAKLLKENDNGIFVGNDLTLADLCVYDILFFIRKVFEFDATTKFPELKALEDKVVANANIKAYISKRKDTPT